MTWILVMMNERLIAGTDSLEPGFREFGLGSRVDWSRENREAGIHLCWQAAGGCGPLGARVDGRGGEVRMQRSLGIMVMRE